MIEDDSYVDFQRNPRRSIFLFVPNVCNAGCDFCYVEPSPSSGAKLSEKLLQGSQKLAESLKQLGFREVRITGGEPLLFDNFEELIEIICSFDLSYTVLTNGILLDNFINTFKKYPPNKVTVSLHSLQSYEEVFNTEDESKKVLNSVEKATNITDITVTIIPLKQNSSEIKKIILNTYKIGVRSFKIICLNIDQNTQKYKSLFLNTINALDISFSDIDFRVTDLNQKSCMLSERSFTSIAMPDFSIYSCCTTVGSGNPYKPKDLNKKSIGRTIRKIENENHNRKPDDLPCNAYIGSCPIALKQKT